MKSYNYLPIKATILKKEVLCDNIYFFRLKLKQKNFLFTPGQFVMISVLGFGEVPIGIAGAPKQNEIEIGVREAGTVTSKICSLEIGDKLGISGPFGKGFPISKLRGRDVAIVAGGIGLFPLRPLIEQHQKNPTIAKSLTVLMGAQTPERLLFKPEHQDWKENANVIETVDTCNREWKGGVGNITTTYENIKPGSVLVCCGPPAIYQTVIDLATQKNIKDEDIYFLLERKMKCGVGKCQHCTCGNLYVCTDGPVFSYHQLKDNQESFI